MALPDFSNSMYVANLRYIQSIHESPKRRNPDTLVRRFLPILQRWRAARLDQDELAKLRQDPFYYYLLARTRYYDVVFTEAVAAGVRQIVSIGCGSDTRSYRFKELLSSKRVKVLECDQPKAIEAKRRSVKRWGGFDHVEHLPLDLNDEAWPELMTRLGQCDTSKVLVMMEGVSPYVNDTNFRQFLRFIGTELSPGSHLAYDFKIRGVNDDFGRFARTEVPFRLPQDREEVAGFHEEYGLALGAFELSSELSTRLVEGLGEALIPLCTEDALVRLQVGRVWG
jgi:methyltransferase (TIGR00027 family)